MTFRSFVLGILRHTGYVLLISGTVYLGVEAVIPGFVTPYLNPYLFLTVGLVLTVAGAWRTSSTVFGRWFMSLSFAVFLFVTLFTQLLFRDATAWLMFATCLLVVAFFVASVYPEEV